LKYGIVDNLPDEQQVLNTELSLLAQIETATALERLEDLASIPNVDIFIGPADLAASLGFPGQTSHPKVLAAGAEIVRVAREHNKRLVTACGIADFIHWTRLGIDLLFCTNDITCLKTGAQLAIDAAAKAIDQAALEARAGDSVGRR
jgi:2-keto-3-deoxy-L-rhamnonate aldolase RhmA